MQCELAEVAVAGKEGQGGPTSRHEGAALVKIWALLRPRTVTCVLI